MKNLKKYINEFKEIIFCAYPAETESLKNNILEKLDDLYLINNKEEIDDILSKNETLLFLDNEGLNKFYHNSSIGMYYIEDKNVYYLDLQ